MGMQKGRLFLAVAAAGLTITIGCGSGLAPSASGTSTATSGNSSTTTPSTPASTNCALSPSLPEPTTFLDGQPNRTDLTTNTTNTFVTNAVPLALTITVRDFNSGSCRALSGAQVDVWQTDAAGRFGDSAADNTLGDPFLRGFQITDVGGVVRFKTVYPGWYTGRAPHMYVMVRTFANSILKSQYETQLFFDPAINATVMALPLYSTRGAPDTTNSSDRIYGLSFGQTLVSLTGSTSGYLGAITVTVQP